VGPQGAVGPRGPQGATGAQGSQGGPGPTGAQGSQGPAGGGGAAGATGAQGAQGSQGGGGANGPTGAQGAPGTQGYFGPTGPGGPTGSQGNTGAPGPPGPTGPTAVTCYSQTIGYEGSAHLACFNPLNATVYSEYSNPCTVGLVQFYDNLSSCQSLTISWGYSAYNYLACGGTYGTVSTNGFWSSIAGCSDRRLKRGIETLPAPLNAILNFDVVEFDWNKNLNSADYIYFEKKNKLHSIGLIAQNIRQYYPEVVEIMSSGYYRINYPKLNAVLVEGIKEQQVFIEDIEQQLIELENKLK
jgi:hypothetical protein